MHECHSTVWAEHAHATVKGHQQRFSIDVWYRKIRDILLGSYAPRDVSTAISKSSHCQTYWRMCHYTKCCGTPKHRQCTEVSTITENSRYLAWLEVLPLSYRLEGLLGESRGIALALLLSVYLGTRWGWVVSTTPRPPCHRERPGTHCTGGFRDIYMHLFTHFRGKQLTE